MNDHRKKKQKSLSIDTVVSALENKKNWLKVLKLMRGFGKVARHTLIYKEAIAFLYLVGQDSETLPTCDSKYI